MAEMTLSELARLVGGELVGDGTRIVRGLAPLESAGGDRVAFLSNPKYEKQVQTTRAAAVLVGRSFAGAAPAGCGLIRCGDAYFAFRQAMVAFCGFRQPEFDGIDQRANIAPTAVLGKGVRVAAFATVGPDVSIGDGCVLYPGVYVGPRSRLGQGCTLYPNVTLYDGTILGNRVTIHAGSSIGHDGFGYATHKGDDGVVRHEKIPQAGWVQIEDDCEIGACCAIDRATMGATIIGAGSKFSNLVAIGHGTRMGRHCLLVAQVGIAGSVAVGNYCVFGGQAGVVGHIRIGDGAKLGAQSGVTNDVPPGEDFMGSPAIPLAQAKRSLASVAHLPEMRTALRALQRQVEHLTAELAALKAGDGQGADHL
jgi:UDP-3-O-[3-hydroxymyristoyl] glucosamine N-acyltransferase